MAVLSIFVSWTIIDYVIHGLLLSDLYRQTAQLWRPMPEMNMGLMYAVTMVGALVLVLMFDRFVQTKNKNTAMQFGFLFGLSAGTSMGFGSFSVMPIPFVMAFVWFLGVVVQGTVAGMLLALTMGDEKRV